MRRLSDIAGPLGIAMLGVGVAYAAASGGGDAPWDSSVALLLIGGGGGLLGTLLWRTSTSSREGSLVNRVTDTAAVLLPAYVVLQLVPLPVALVRVISPARAALADRLDGLNAASSFVPLTISVPTTAAFLLRVAACATVFLTVRQFAAASDRRRWGAAVPLVAVALVEAFIAFVQPDPHGWGITGTFASRNHFANLLGMALPFALGFAGMAILGRRDAPLSAGRALAATASIAGGVALAVGVALSFSKMGAIAALSSVLATAALGGARLSARHRRIALPLLPVVAVAFIVWLTPPELIGRFASMAGSSDPTEGRSAVTQDALRLAASYPLVGVGFGNFYPGLLPYQTVTPDLAWVNAHDDYVQFLTELGVAGFLIVAALVMSLLWRSAHAVKQADTSEAAWFAAACTGALVMFLVHSASEFNSYVLANALTMSWVAGLAASLPLVEASWLSRYPQSRLVPICAVTCVVFTTVWATGWLVFLRSFHSDVRMEAAFCRLGICDTAAALETLRRSEDPDKPAPLPVDSAVEYLRRDSASPTRWADAGRALLQAERRDDAVYAYTQAERLAPRIPTVLLDAADFQFEVNRPQTALLQIAHALRETDDEDVRRGAFNELQSRGVDVRDAFERALPNTKTMHAYFRWLVEQDDLRKSEIAWDVMLMRGDLDGQLASRFINVLLDKGETETAARDWVRFTAAAVKAPDATGAASHESAQYVFNGGFEADLTGCRLDWHIELGRVSDRGVDMNFDGSVRHGGARSLRVQFDGEKNVGDLDAEQWLVLDGGHYLLNAYVRTEGVSTDQGVRIRLASSSTSPSAVNVATNDARGTSDWTLLECEFDAPSGGGLVRLWLARTPSLKFDSLVKGTAWVDDVSVVKVG